MSKKIGVLPILVGARLAVGHMAQADLARYRSESLARELGRAWAKISIQEQEFEGISGAVEPEPEVPPDEM